jgi:hypothetical protein
MELMFRNESDVVARKAKTKYQQLSKEKERKVQREKELHISSSSSSSSSGDDITNSESDFSWSPTTASDLQLVAKRAHGPFGDMTWGLVPSIEDQAVGFFFSNYVVQPTFIPRGQYDFLPELLNQPHTERILQTSVTAAGLAGLANATKCPQIMKQAQQQYANALAMTNKALRTRATAVRDSTIISVILLGLYENFRSENKQEAVQWAKHVNGACTLINMRGKEFLHSSMGHKLFQQFYGVALLAAFQTKTRVPQGISEFWETNARIGDYTVAGKVWTTEIVRFMQHTIDLVADTTSDPLTLVNSALQRDEDLNAVYALLPNIWKHEVVYLDKPVEHVYGNCYNMYLDPWIVQMLNNLQSVRLVLHNVIRDQLHKGAQQYPPLFTQEQISLQINTSEQTIRKAVAQICATVPQVTGQIPFPDLPPTRASMETSFSDLFDPHDPMFQLRPPGTYLDPMKPRGLHNLIWPLYTAARESFNPPDLKEWAANVLYFVALKTGARQAAVLADEVKQYAQAGFVVELDSGP